MISSSLKGRSSPLNPHEDQFKGLANLEKAALSKSKEKKDYVTIFNDPINFNIKHPLQSSWTLFYDSASKRPPTRDWTQNIKELVTFSTVEDFWGVFNNISKISELSIGSNFHLFKEGIRPAWEDPQNANGGRWMCQPNRQNALSFIDDLWLYSILHCIGESASEAEETCGLVVSSRKAFFRISLWTRSSSDANMLKRVGTQFREAIDLTPKEQLEFQPHNDSHKFADKSEKLFV